MCVLLKIFRIRETGCSRLFGCLDGIYQAVGKELCYFKSGVQLKRICTRARWGAEKLSC